MSAIRPQRQRQLCHWHHHALSFLGIKDVEFVYAEGLAMGDGARDKALAGADEKIALLAARRGLHPDFAVAA